MRNVFKMLERFYNEEGVEYEHKTHYEICQAFGINKLFDVEGNLLVEYNYVGDDTKVCEFWYNEKGEYHRHLKPSNIYYHLSGRVMCENFYDNGKLHNLNRPAVVRYTDDSKNLPEYVEYYIYGVRFKYKESFEMASYEIKSYN